MASAMWAMPSGGGRWSPRLVPEQHGLVLLDLCEEPAEALAFSRVNNLHVRYPPVKMWTELRMGAAILEIPTGSDAVGKDRFQDRNRFA
jgi:hypothetical protein